jgi:hypothetical protein
MAAASAARRAQARRGLAGLAGLGGGEFRLPVLMYVVGYPARTAVPLNLAVSLDDGASWCVVPLAAHLRRTCLVLKSRRERIAHI